MASDDRRLVYSTDPSVRVDAKFATKRVAPQRAAGPPDDGVVRVGCERRRGGSVTSIHGLDSRELLAVANELKRRCGTGGTVKDGVVTLQGDKREAALAYFSERGRRAKKMGG